MKGKVMTRKDYEVIARIVAVVGRGAGVSRYEKRGEYITAQLKAENEKFDVDRFWGAVEKASKGIM